MKRPPIAVVTVIAVLWAIIIALWIGTFAAWVFIAYRWWHHGP